MSWIIYKHTNIKNGKVYIGQTMQKAIYRWGKFGQKYSEDNIKFYHAIQKYKKEDPNAWDTVFKHEIIEDNIQTQEEADAREIYWIAHYDSYLNGYNMTKGGRDGEYLGIPILQIDMKNLNILNEFQSTQDAARSLRKEHGSPISACCLGKQISAYGFFWCKKEDYYCGWKPRENKSTRAIYQIDKQSYRIINEYNSISEAEDEYETTGISSCCKRVREECIGFYWCYVSDYNDEWTPPSNKHKKQVVQLDDNLNVVNIFDSIQNACSNTRSNMSSIINCCRGKYTKANNYYWCYYENLGSFIPRRRVENHTNAKIVCQIDKTTLKCINKFPSIPVAAKYSNCSKDSIGKCCRKEDVIETGGFYWCYESDLQSFKPKQRIDRKKVYTQEIKDKISKANSKRVRCIETGQLFVNECTACHFAGVSKGRVGASIKKGQKAGGYSWEFVE